MQKSQIKSKQRVADHGEVFTNEREVKAMLDLVKHETERIESRFLEPACGDGNFLAEVLNRKLDIVEQRYKKSQTDFEKNALLAISSIYGVDFLEDNAQTCRDRLFNLFNDSYTRNFKNKVREECTLSAKYLFSRNIIWGDALDFTNPITKEPVVFSEWSLISSGMMKRKDFVFKFLVEKSMQTSLFNDEGEPAAIDEPIKEYPPIHYTKLYTFDNN